MISLRRWFTASALLGVALSGAAYAAELFTPALVVEGSRRVACVAHNVGSTPQTVRVDILKHGGVNADSLSSFPCGDLRPGARCETFVQNAGTTTFVSCKVTALRKTGVRASIQDVDAGVALEAR